MGRSGRGISIRYEISCGGGLYNYGGTLVLTNTTVSGNRATKNGGGIANFNSAYTGTVTLANVTLTNNTADSNADGDGGGIHRSAGTVNLKNTLVAGNFDNSLVTQRPDCSGTVVSQGYHFLQNTTGCTITGDTTGNQTGTSAQLNGLGKQWRAHADARSIIGQPGHHPSATLRTGTNTGCRRRTILRLRSGRLPARCHL